MSSRSGGDRAGDLEAAFAALATAENELAIATIIERRAAPPAPEPHILDGDARAELDRLLGGTAQQRAAFLDAIEDALHERAQLFLPTERATQDLDGQFERLAEAAKAFERALAALARPNRARLIGTMMLQRRDDGAPPVDLRSIGADLDHAERVAAAAARAVERFSKRKRPRSSGPRASSSTNELIRRLAIGYAYAFGEQPSSNCDGIFARALKVVLAGIGVKEKVGDDRLHALLVIAAETGAAPARRGRKRKSEKSPAGNL
jgi:hypothetical protein